MDFIKSGRWNCWANWFSSLSVVSVSDWLEIVSIGCWLSTVRPFSLEGEAASEVFILVSKCSMALTVEVSLVTKLVLLDLLLGKLSKGWSRDCLVELFLESNWDSILSNCLPIVFKHWLV